MRSGSHTGAASSIRSWNQRSRPSVMCDRRRRRRRRGWSTRSTTTTCSIDGRRRQRHVGDGLEQVGLAPPEAAVGGDQHLALGVVDAVGQRVGREPAEHHRVRGADAGAGQHGHRQLGDHRHVDGDPIALADAQALEHVGEALDRGQQVGVGDGAVVAGLALPVVGDLLPLAGLDVAVEAVVGDVQRAADEPLGEREVPVEDRCATRRTRRRGRRPGGPRTPASRPRPRRRSRRR